MRAFHLAADVTATTLFPMVAFLSACVIAGAVLPAALSDARFMLLRRSGLAAAPTTRAGANMAAWENLCAGHVAAEIISGHVLTAFYFNHVPTPRNSLDNFL